MTCDASHDCRKLHDDSASPLDSLIISRCRRQLSASLWVWRDADRIGNTTTVGVTAAAASAAIVVVAHHHHPPASRTIVGQPAPSESFSSPIARQYVPNTIATAVDNDDDADFDIDYAS